MSIYVKTLEGWEPLVEGSLEGAPGFPIILNPVGGSVIFFEAGVEGSAGPTIAYGAYITPSGDGATVEVDQETLEIAVSGTEPFTSYRVYVYGVNAAGKGDPSSTNPFQLNYNEATGGTVTVVDDYNGTGETWQVHDFGNSGGTFTVEAGPKDFRVMAAGPPGAGGIVASGRGGGGGGGGEVLDVEVGFTAGVYPVTVNAVNGVSARGGASGAQGWSVSNKGQGGASGNGNPGGGQSSDGWNAGGGGGSGGAGGNCGGNQCAGGGVGVYTNISGFSQSLGTGGGGGAQNNGCGGQAGKVVIAYQIGVTSTTQIKNAQAKQAVRSQGQDVGYAEGFSEGYVDFEPLPIPDEDTE